MIDLSIIIPIYNKEEYIERCLDSILVKQNADFDKLQIVCIDDGCTDKSIEILKEKYSSYNNITLVNQENKGASTARNTGIKAATGKYVWFVDADDFISENTLGDLLKILDADYDLLTFNIFEENRKNESLTVETIGGETIPAGYTWANIAKLEIIKANNLLFNEYITYGEDTLFWIQVGIFCKVIAKLNKPLYYYQGMQGVSDSIMDKLKDLEYKVKQSFDMLRTNKILLEQLKTTEIENKHVWARIIDIILTYNLLILRKVFFINKYYKDTAFTDVYPLPFWIRFKYLYWAFDTNKSTAFKLVFLPKTTLKLIVKSKWSV